MSFQVHLDTGRMLSSKLQDDEIPPVIVRVAADFRANARSPMNIIPLEEGWWAIVPTSRIEMVLYRKETP